MTSRSNISNLRAFLPAKDFTVSRAFYEDLGGKIMWESTTMALFQLGHTEFYLQDAYVKDWAKNCMLFLMVEDLETLWRELREKDLVDRYPGVRW